MNTDNQNQNNSFENGGNINPNYQDSNINNQYNDYQNNNNNYNNPNMNPNPNEGQNINNNMYICFLLKMLPVFRLLKRLLLHFQRMVSVL